MGGNGELGYQWEPVGYEELAWRVDPDALEGVPKSRRRKITCLLYTSPSPRD